MIQWQDNLRSCKWDITSSTIYDANSKTTCLYHRIIKLPSQLAISNEYVGKDNVSENWGQARFRIWSISMYSKAWLIQNFTAFWNSVWTFPKEVKFIQIYLVISKTLIICNSKRKICPVVTIFIEFSPNTSKLKLKKLWNKICLCNKWYCQNKY
jgi:hypothetical protein